MNKKFNKKVNYLLMIYGFQILSLLLIPGIFILLIFIWSKDKDVTFNINSGYVTLIVVIIIIGLIMYGRIVAFKKCLWIKKTYSTQPSAVKKIIKERLDIYKRIRNTQRRFYDYHGLMRGLLTYRLFSDLLFILENDKNIKNGGNK